MPNGVGNDKTTGDHMYDHPRSFQGQGDPGFAQREYGNSWPVLIIGTHEMPSGPSPDAFDCVQWNCSSLAFTSIYYIALHIEIIHKYHFDRST